MSDQIFNNNIDLKDLCRIYIGGHPVDVIGRDGLVERFISDCDSYENSTRLVYDINGQGISMYASDAHYREAVDGADIVHADGQIVVSASRKIGIANSIPDRSATTDMIHDIAAISERRAIKFFLLGGPEGLAVRTASILKKKYPNLDVVGTHNGYFSETDCLEIIENINSVAPDVVWVGLGKPREQIFCTEYRDFFKVPWVVTCGGCFHFITGDYPRAPEFMQNFGLEWLYRMVRNPRKLFWRYVKTNPHAMWLIRTRSGVDSAENKII